MGRIHLLEDDVINKIAAGEVVERPASVVKELVENALDAGATAIDVDIIDGGRKLISVADNGFGMSGEDMALAVRRHATSKITNVDDLFRVSSMGFRGEALASIAAVSRFQIASRQAEDEIGKCLLIQGGDVGGVETRAKADCGTTITVEDLFYNVPARAAFLKSPAAEYTHINELLRAIALARPTIRITLRHNRKEQLLLSAQEQPAAGAFYGEEILRARFAEVIDDGKLARKMLYVQRADEMFQWEALLSPPGYERMNSKGLYLFVNNRWVRDQALRYALLRGYHSHLLKGRYPLVMLRLTVNPSLVDVNVHPAKTEIRLQYANDIHNHIAAGVRDRLRQADYASPTPDVPEIHASLAPRAFSESSYQRPLSAPEATYRAATPGLAARIRNTSLPRHVPSRSEFRAPAPADLFATPSADNVTGINWDELAFVGTFARLYLIFQAQERMLVVDQHAFHERILYERLLADPTVLGGCQPLLVPEAIRLTGQQRESWEQIGSHLSALGFDLALQGEDDLEIRAVPALLTRRDPMALVTALLEQGQAASADDAKTQIAHLTLATIACHAAVRGGEELSADDLTQLISQAATVDFYHNCPHGRRVFKWWSKQEISHWFDR